VPVETGAAVKFPETDPFTLLLPVKSDPIEPFAPDWLDDDALGFASDGLELRRPRLLPPGVEIPPDVVAADPVDRHVSLPPMPVSVPVQLPEDPPAHCAAAKVAGAATSIKANVANSIVFRMISFPGHQLQLERIARWWVPQLTETWVSQCPGYGVRRSTCRIRAEWIGASSGAAARLGAVSHE
jgi:hypothetical protein